ncbi:hypothetical protein [Metamycoplasma gateae]|uniref:Uncharacterized protein n=1 Tax=Metamycoplasma gateae TaxID=35769 RepID=A0ABZ2AK62_9BACT|nr:hypothetical protein V2E26_00070 [Metamycoplasma gateae]
MNKDGDWENYYISIEKINLNDPIFRFIDEYFLGNNIKLNKIFSVSNTFFNTFSTFKKLNKKLSKIESINDRIDFIDDLMFAKPSTFQVDNNILDLEQVSLLRYKLTELANNLK